MNLTNKSKTIELLEKTVTIFFPKESHIDSKDLNTLEITFSEEKPQILPDSVIDKMLNELKIKDLGSLKEKIKITKNRLNRYMNEILQL